MSGENSKCPMCSVQNAYSEKLRNFDLYFFECNNCGRFVISPSMRDINNDTYAHLLFYNNNIALPVDDDNFFYFIGKPSTYDFLVKEYPCSLLLKYETLEAWYPKNLNERVNYILDGLANLSDYPGKEIYLDDVEYIKSLFFINRYSNGKYLPLEECIKQIDYMAAYMLSQDLIKKENSFITILPEGWRLIAELQKNKSNSKTAFIAMSFSENMKDIQEAVEKGIIRAGYIPHVMNKIEHNNQIVPEILYQIKQSKFVVAEFSTNNNGAYYEAGYAAGLGKEVIHICNNDKFNEEGHFDIKQKSTVLWKTVDEIPEALFKRIEATIGKIQ
jgi:nucleoside 2-deoxyribosyltransferase